MLPSKVLRKYVILYFDHTIFRNHVKLGVMLTSFDDIKIFLQPLNYKVELVNQEKLSYEEYQEFVINYVSLPDFFTLEEKSPVYIIEATETNIVVKHLLTGDVVATYEKTSEDAILAYDFVSKVLDGDVKFFGDFSVIDNVKYLGKKSLTIRRDGKSSSRLLLSHTSQDDEHHIKSNYIGFLRTVETYLTDPDNFLSSWDFINLHPALWHRWDAKKDTSWVTDNGVAKMWIQPTLNENGVLVFMMEAGAAVAPERTSHYHDLRLDVWGSSYEDGIVQTAALLHKFFNVDGSEKENVEYEKSELEMILDDRIGEWEADQN